MNVLVINAGSSSLKYQLLDVDTRRGLRKGNYPRRIGIEGSLLVTRSLVERSLSLRLLFLITRLLLKHVFDIHKTS